MNYTIGENGVGESSGYSKFENGKFSRDGPAAVTIEEVPMTKEEELCREELALSYRQMFREGLYEGCDTHLSIMLDEQEAFLTLPYGILWSTVEASDLALVAYNGQVLRNSGRINQLTGEPHGPDITAVALHGPLHKKLGSSRCKSVFHTHQRFGTTMACSEEEYELQMIHQNHARFYKSVIYDREFNGLAYSFDEGKRMAEMFAKEGNENMRVMT